MMRVHAGVRRLWWKPLAGIAVAAIAASAPWWGPRTLRRMAFFRVRRIEVDGARYLTAPDVLRRLAVDTSTSVWIDLHALERRVAAHPQVRSVTIERKLPATLVVHIIENLPVAFVPTRNGVAAVDVSGRTLPIDPSRVLVDLPVLARPDTAVLRVLADIQTRAPELYGRIEDVRRLGRDDLALQVADQRVLATLDLSADRLADIIPVENDLARRNVRVAELDLRFRDQVIARLQ